MCKFHWEVYGLGLSLYLPKYILNSYSVSHAWNTEMKKKLSASFLPSKRRFCREQVGKKSYIRYRQPWVRQIYGLWEHKGRAHVELSAGMFLKVLLFVETDYMVCFSRLCCLPNSAKKLLSEPSVLRQAVPVDLFPHTLHWELVLLCTLMSRLLEDCKWFVEEEVSAVCRFGFLLHCRPWEHSWETQPWTESTLDWVWKEYDSRDRFKP